MPLIRQKELRLGGWLEGQTYSANTIRKYRREFGLKPTRYDGNEPMFQPEDVEAAKERQTRKLNKRFNVA